MLTTEKEKLQRKQIVALETHLENLCSLSEKNDEVFVLRFTFRDVYTKNRKNFQFLSQFERPLICNHHCWKASSSILRTCALPSLEN